MDERMYTLCHSETQNKIVLKNFIKIIKECHEEILIKLAIVIKISKSSWNTDILYHCKTKERPIACEWLVLLWFPYLNIKLILSTWEISGAFFHKSSKKSSISFFLISATALMCDLPHMTLQNYKTYTYNINIQLQTYSTNITVVLVNWYPIHPSPWEP